jgi:hypothetical protein
MWQTIIERMQSRFAAMLPAAWDLAAAAALLVGAGIIALLLHTAILALIRRALGIGSRSCARRWAQLRDRRD